MMMKQAGFFSHLSYCGLRALRVLYGAGREHGTRFCKIFLVRVCFASCELATLQASGASSVSLLFFLSPFSLRTHDRALGKRRHTPQRLKPRDNPGTMNEAEVDRQINQVIKH